MSKKGIEQLKPLIIVPTYNEKENLENIVAAILAEIPFTHILIVDDSSPDGTGAIADALAEADERLHVLHRTEKNGLGPAYVAGFRWAFASAGGYNRLIEMDADFSHPPEYLAGMLERSLDADVVIGSRYVKGGRTENWGLGRKVLSRGGGLYARTILGMKIQDLTAGFVCWRPEVLESLGLEALYANGYAFQIELKYRAHKRGYRLAELPIHFPDRIAGTSKMSPKIAVEALLTVLKLRFKKT